MRINPISTNSNLMQKKNQNFKMALHVPRTTKNLIDGYMVSRVIDPIEWLATARALEKSEAVYYIMKLTRLKASFFDDGDKFVITRHAPNEEDTAVVVKPEKLLASIQALDSAVLNQVQIERRIIDGNIQKVTTSISSHKPEISIESGEVKPLEYLEENGQKSEI